MKTILRLEEAGKFIGAYLLTLHLGFAWWTFFAWLLAPDASMIGYVINTRVGAWLYNIVHHQGLAVVVGFAGLWMGDVNLEFAGLLLFGHSSMDRMVGYGLKYEDDFKNTHLGRMA